MALTGDKDISMLLRLSHIRDEAKKNAIKINFDFTMDKPASSSTIQDFNNATRYYT